MNFQSEDTLCHCRHCLTERAESDSEAQLWLHRMILCSTCGNKRCPHATDHRLECTGSNEPGQKGSIYE